MLVKLQDNKKTDHEDSDRKHEAARKHMQLVCIVRGVTLHSAHLPKIKISIETKPHVILEFGYWFTHHVLMQSQH